MTSFVSGDSVFLPTGDPIAGSPLVVQGSVNLDTRGTGLGVNLKILNIGDTGNDDVIYTENVSDIIETGAGNDIVAAGGGDDFVDGGDGHDIIRGQDGDDVIRGGKGSDVLIGGHGADIFVVTGDPATGAFGAESDLTFDENGHVLSDEILDFNDHEDVLVLQDLGLDNGTGSVHYDENTGDVILTNEGNGDQFVIAKLQAGLDIAVVDQGGGNYTLL